MPPNYRQLYEDVHGPAGPTDIVGTSNVATQAYIDTCVAWYTEQEKRLKEFNKNNPTAAYYSSELSISRGSNTQILACFNEWTAKFKDDGRKFTQIVSKAMLVGFFPDGDPKPDSTDEDKRTGLALWWRLTYDHVHSKPLGPAGSASPSALEKVASRLRKAFKTYPLIIKALRYWKLRTQVGAASKALVVMGDEMAHQAYLKAHKENYVTTMGLDGPKKLFLEDPGLVELNTFKYTKGATQVKQEIKEEPVGPDEDRPVELPGGWPDTVVGQLNRAAGMARNAHGNGYRNPFFYMMIYAIEQYEFAVLNEETAGPDFHVYYGQNGRLTVNADGWSRQERIDTDADRTTAAATAFMENQRRQDAQTAAEASAPTEEAGEGDEEQPGAMEEDEDIFA